MRIEAIAAEVPSIRVTNGDLLRLVADANVDQPAALVSGYVNGLDRLLRKAGACTRYRRDPASGERAIDLIVRACRRAIVDSQLVPGDINLLIYCGVGRGFLEPANAYFVAQALGISCDCFDISDACMSWVRSLHVSYAFLRNKEYARILVVNGEFHAYERGIPSALPIRSPDQLRYTFPTFTIGEMATASVLVPSDHKWRFAFRSEPSQAGACTIPLPGYTDFAEPDERLGLNGINQLVSFGEELSAFALQRMLDFVPTCVADPLAVDLWMPHAASATLCKIAESKLSLHGRLFGDVFPEYGNVVSASIPTGIAMALKSNRLKRGDRLILCPASAGMSFALVEFVY